MIVHNNKEESRKKRPFDNISIVCRLKKFFPMIKLFCNKTKEECRIVQTRIVSQHIVVDVLEKTLRKKLKGYSVYFIKRNLGYGNTAM